MITPVKKAAFNGQMETQIEKDVARELGIALRKVGKSKAVTKFLNNYGNFEDKEELLRPLRSFTSAG